MNKKNLIQRARTAVVFVGLLIAMVMINQYTYAILMGAVIALSIFEFMKLSFMAREKNRISHLYMPLAIGMGLTSFVLTFLSVNGIIPETWAIFFPVAPLLFFVLELWADSARPFTNVSINILSLFYLAYPISLLNFIAFPGGEYNRWIVLSMLLLIWVYDAGAYVFGSLFGRNKLFPRISPGKTWEGSLGGLFAAEIVAFLIYKIFGIYELHHWVVIAIIICLFGTLGDLIESMMKRGLKIKDSGNILPGHGGMLDRFDAFYFMIPFVYLYIKLFVN